MHDGASLEARRQSARLDTVAATCEALARPEPDCDMLGTYMWAAIEHGGYRAALEYYSGEECKKSDAPVHRLRVEGWLLGRLGLYDRVKDWLEEASAYRDFARFLPAAGSVPRATYRPPPLWLEKPRPVPRRSGDIMTLEPVAAPCRDTGEVPDYIWTSMLILDATGPIFSHAGLGAVSFLVAAGPDRRAPGPAHGDRRYDPCRGARLHGAPEGCHRWIIADIDFGPRPPNKPHYYYDLTDEGRRALADAGAARPPWSTETAAAAAGLAGMALPDLLEGACTRSGPLRDLDAMRGDLGKLVDAWRAQDDGKDVPPVSAGDQVLADLGLNARWPETGGSAGCSFDHLLHLVGVINATRSVACEAEPSRGVESAVLQTLIAAIQDQCRMHGRMVAASTSPANPFYDPALVDPAEWGADARRWPLYADVAPPMISDLYYCLAEYCRSRGLAVDPCSLPLYERFTDDERAAVIEALEEDSPYRDVD